MTPLQLPDWLGTNHSTTAYYKPIFESEKKSYGTLYNSFHELESDYKKLSNTILGIKSWSVGPVSSLANKDDEKKGNRGHMEELAEEEEWLNWLNSKQIESVLYLSFGSVTRLDNAQIVEIAHGLENSDHNFIWVVTYKEKGKR
ncbi:putative soyasapogenol B glucuronide galactosyltransferase [Medicago truncatula]|uniref:Putative soyasapogenol B glucuronide galactosyltransferase n=1 Tax=Medicago truncatula TaxID=3880 RepID=A0A396H1F0_MEDTR|nr:putative soyasapogenol B glucuronide galactosyltransferase [Medicago truncatula]